MAAPSIVVPKLEWPGATKWIADTDKFTIHVTRNQVPQMLGEVRAAKSKLKKYPIKPMQTFEDWAKDNEEVDETILRKQDEDLDDYIVRINRPSTDAQDMGLVLLNRLGSELFGQPEIPEDDYNQMKWLNVKSFIYNLLLQADIEANEYAPRKRVKETIQD